MMVSEAEGIKILGGSTYVDYDEMANQGLLFQFCNSVNHQNTSEIFVLNTGWLICDAMTLIWRHCTDNTSKRDSPNAKFKHTV